MSDKRKAPGARTAPKFGVVLAAIVLVALVAAVLLAPRLANTELSAAELAKLSPADRLKSYNDIRGTLIQAIVGGLFLVTAYFSWRGLQVSRQQAEIARASQVTERLVRALEHLGPDKDIAVQAAGIYSLKQVGRDSDEDRPAAIELLTTLLRERAAQTPASTAPRLPASASAPADATEPSAAVASGDRPSVVQAALSSLSELRQMQTAGPYPRLKGLDFRDLDLGTADLSRWAMERCWFDGARLVGRLVNTSLVEATFSGAHLQGADLSGADLTSADMRRSKRQDHPAVLRKTSLHGAILDYAKLNGVNFVDAKFHAVPPDDADPAAGGKDLRPASLGNAFLCGADLIRARLDGVDLVGAHLESTEEDGVTDLTDAWLGGASLLQAHLCGAVLVNAHLNGADLRRAHLNAAVLRGADFRGADLRGAHLDHAGVDDRTRFEGARCSKRTTWPDGFDWQAAGVELVVPEANASP